MVLSETHIYSSFNIDSSSSRAANRSKMYKFIETIAEFKVCMLSAYVASMERSFQHEQHFTCTHLAAGTAQYACPSCIYIICRSRCDTVLCHSNTHFFCFGVIKHTYTRQQRGNTSPHPWLPLASRARRIGGRVLAEWWMRWTRGSGILENSSNLTSGILGALQILFGISWKLDI